MYLIYFLDSLWCGLLTRPESILGENQSVTVSLFYSQETNTKQIPVGIFAYHMVLSSNPWSKGRDSVQKLSVLLTPTWQCLWKSSRFKKRVEFPDSDLEMYRITSSNTVSSQGIANGPWLVKPYSSSAWTKSFLKTGWFKYVARTTNLLQLLPTQIATCPAGTSEGMRLAEIRALLRHRRSNCLSLTMWRILLHFPMPAAIVLLFPGINWLQRKRREKEWKIERGKEGIETVGGRRLL